MSTNKVSIRVLSFVLVLCMLLGLAPSGVIFGKATATEVQTDDLSQVQTEPMQSPEQPTEELPDEQSVMLPDAETKAASPSVLFHFDGKTGNTFLDSVAAWDGGSTTMYKKDSISGGDLILNTAGSRLEGAFNKLTRVSDGVSVGPQIRSKAFSELNSSFSYTMNSGDIIEIRMRVDTTAGAVNNLQIHLAADGSFVGHYTGNSGYSWDTGSNFAYYRATVNSGCINKKLTQIQLALVAASDADKEKLVGEWDIDYIFIGQLEDAPSQHLVTFYDYDGTTILKQGYVENGKTATAPVTPGRATVASKHYTFSKWVTAKGGSTAATLTNITKDTNVYASYTEHAVTFPTYDETRHQVKCATCNKTWWEAHTFNSSGKCTLCGATKNSASYLLIDFDNRDTLNRLVGWNESYSLTTVNNLKVNNSEYTGSFKTKNPFIRTCPNLLNYTVKEGDWVDIRMKVDNNDPESHVIERITVFFWIDSKAHVILSFDSANLVNTDGVYRYYRAKIPEKLSDNTQVWNKAITQIQIGFYTKDDQVVTGNFGVDYIYIGKPEIAYSQHLVTFYDYNGTTVLKTQYVTEGEAATAPTIPLRNPDSEKHYTFNQWVTTKGGSTAANLNSITKDTNIYASYTEAGHTYRHVGYNSAIALCKDCLWQVKYHTLTYTNNGANHTVKCGSGCKEYTEEHSYRGNVCICGASNEYLFFGFKNTTADKNRYKSDLYGNKNFDVADNWSGTNNTRGFSTSGDGTMTITPKKENGAAQYSVLAVTGESTTTTPLNYVPEAGDVYQIRVKFQNIKARDGYKPLLRLYYADEKGKLNTGASAGDYLELELNPLDVSGGEYQVYTVAITHKMANLSRIYSIAPYFGHLNTQDANAKIVVDYIYMGKPAYLENITKYDIEGNPAIAKNAYDGLTDVTEPNDEVSIDKNANPVGEFNKTGVAKVELLAKGTSEKKAIDLLFVLDVSNSMAWSVENDGVYDTQKIARDGQTTKMEEAVSMMDEFARQLLGGNSAGTTISNTDNTFSLVTFAGYDKEHNDGTGAAYTDSVMTAFTAQKNINLVSKALNLTSTYGVNRANSETIAIYNLSIGTIDGNGTVGVVSGRSRGGTNYDYGFSEAIKAVDNIKKAVKGSVANYDKSDRQLVVVFLADGMPTSYNGVADFESCGYGYSTKGVEKVVTGDYKYGTKEYIRYAGDADSAKKTETQIRGYRWLNYFVGKPNDAASTLYGKVDRFEAVGFDMAHGLYSNLIPENTGEYPNNPDNDKTPEEVETITQQAKNNVPVVLKKLVAGTTLNYKDAENALALENFRKELISKLQFAGTYTTVTDVVGKNFNLQTAAQSGTGSIKVALDPAPTIQVTKNGTAIEKVTFSADGKKAYSSLLGNGNIMSDDGTSIQAVYFTYTKDNSSNETFEWNISNLDANEYKLIYYVYLEGSLEGKREKNNYPTNESADLEYVDVLGNHATKVYGKPELPWGQAVTVAEYYLVNEFGEPVDFDGNVVAFEDRVIIDTTSSINYNLNSSKSVNGETYVPSGYTMYNPDAAFMSTSYSAGGGSVAINDTFEGGTTYRVDDGTNPASTKVAFAVVISGFKLVPDTIVLDYGKPIDKDVTLNEVRKNNTYVAVGFLAYSSTTDLTKTYTDVGVTEFVGENGVFSVANGIVTYTPTRFMSSVDDVFVVVKVTNQDNEVTYRYQQLTVLPATNVLYETNFSQEAFDSSLYFGFTNTDADKERYRTVTYGNRNYDADGSNWVTWNNDGSGTNRASANYSIDNTAGIMKVDVCAQKPDGTYGSTVKTTLKNGTNDCNGSVNYVPSSGDVVMIRFKLTNCAFDKGTSAATKPTVEFQYGFEKDAKSFAQKEFTFANDKYITLEIPVDAAFTNAAAVNFIAFRFRHIKQATTAGGSIDIDYIYVGKQIENDQLVFDFVNDSDAQTRYDAPAYDYRNFDKNGWVTYANGTGNGNFSFDYDAGVLKLKVTDGISGGIYGPTVKTSSKSGVVDNDTINASLNYVPADAEILRVRFMLKNCVFDQGNNADTKPAIEVQYRTETDGVISNVVNVSNVAYTFANDKYITVEIPLPAALRSADRMCYFALRFKHIKQATADGGYVDIDHIFIGEKLSTEPLYFDFTNDSIAHSRYSTPTYGHRNYDDADNWTKEKNISDIAVKDGNLRVTSSSPFPGTAYGGATQMHFHTNIALNAVPGDNDVFVMRFKLEGLPSDRAALKRDSFNFLAEGYDGTKYAQIAWIGGVSYNSVDGVYHTVKVSMDAFWKDADWIGRLKINMNGIPAGTVVVIDYIYVGPESGAPASVEQSGELFFDFGNSFEDQNRYASDPAYNGNNYDLTSSWMNSSNAPIKTVDNGNGTLSFTANSAETSRIRNKLDFVFTPGTNDYYQVRFKLTNLGDVEETGTFNFTVESKDTAGTHLLSSDTEELMFSVANDKYYTATKKMNNNWKGNMKQLFLNFAGLPVGTVVEVDYIYVGPESGLPVPKQSFDNLFFGFGNGDSDRLRYETVPMYGGKNFDIDNWSRASSLNKPSFLHATGVMTYEFTGKGIEANTTRDDFWLQSSKSSSSNLPLTFTPTGAEELQLLFKMDNFVKADANKDTVIYFQFYTDESNLSYNGTTASEDQIKTIATRTISKEDMTSGKLVTLTVDLTKEASDNWKNAKNISAIRLFVDNVANETGKTGVFTVDYLYIGVKGGVTHFIPSGNGNIANALTTYGSGWSEWKSDVQTDNKQDDGTVGHGLNAGNTNCLYFGFENTVADWQRYDSAVYGKINFDSAKNWSANAASVKDIAVKDGDLICTVVKDGSTDDGGAFDFKLGETISTLPLAYVPAKGDICEIRFKIVDGAASAGNGGRIRFTLYARNSAGKNQGYQMNNIPFADANGQYFTYSYKLPESWTSLDKVYGLTVGWNFFKADSKLYIDYIYVGPESGSPNHKTYGYDSSYANDKGLSNGTGLHANGLGVDATTTEFIFTGTGFDIISATGSKQGTFRTKVYNAKTGELVRTWSVTNKSDTNLDLYQVPALSIDDLPYGTYRVEIGVLAPYHNPAFPGLTRGGEFFFDAIRIYNPINTSKGASSTGDSLIAFNAYTEDMEANPSIVEIRETLVQGVATDEGFKNGFGFVDYYNGTGVASANWDEYTNISPKTEVYLAKGQAVAFQVYTTAIPTGFHIAAKSVDGRPVEMTAVIGNSATATTNVNTVVKTIATSAPMYYDLFSGTSANKGTNTAFNGNTAFVVVTNSSDEDGVLSITDVKAIFAQPGNTASYRPVEKALSFARFTLARIFGDTPIVKNGIIQENGNFMYYVEGVLQCSAGLIEMDGNYYYIRSGGQAAIGKYWVTNTNDLMEEGYYTFGADGRMIMPEQINGIIEEDGKLYYYVDGKLVCGAGLIELNDKYYYIRSNGQAAVGNYWVTNTNGLMPEGFYTFLEDGSLSLKNGIVDVDGVLYYYINNDLQLGAGLIELNGKYYYIRSNGQAAVGSYWVTKTNGLLAEGMYIFAADGSMVLKNGIVDVDGALYYYVNDKLQSGAGLIEVDGYYYYIRSNGQAAIGKYWVTKTNGLVEEGYYTFGDDGKMIQN